MRQVIVVLALLFVASPALAQQAQHVQQNDAWYPGKLLNKLKQQAEDFFQPHAQPEPTPDPPFESPPRPAQVQQQPIIIYHVPPMPTDPPKPTWSDGVATWWSYFKTTWDAGHILTSIALLVLTLFGFRRRGMAAPLRTQ